MNLFKGKLLLIYRKYRMNLENAEHTEKLPNQYNESVNKLIAPLVFWTFVTVLRFNKYAVENNWNLLFFISCAQNSLCLFSSKCPYSVSHVMIRFHSFRPRLWTPIENANQI